VHYFLAIASCVSHVGFYFTEFGFIISIFQPELFSIALIFKVLLFLITLNSVGFRLHLYSNLVRLLEIHNSWVVMTHYALMARRCCHRYRQIFI